MLSNESREESLVLFYFILLWQSSGTAKITITVYTLTPNDTLTWREGNLRATIIVEFPSRL